MAAAPSGAAAHRPSMPDEPVPSEESDQLPEEAPAEQVADDSPGEGPEQREAETGGEESDAERGGVRKATGEPGSAD